MMYLLLLLILCGLTVGIYFLFRKDILSPSFLFAFMFSVSIFSAIVAEGYWNDIELSWPVFIFPVIGVLFTAIGEGLVRLVLFLLERRRRIRGEEGKTFVRQKNLDVIKTNPIFLIFLYVFVVAMIGLLIVEMSKITGIGDNIPEMINQYRNLTPLFNASEGDVSISTLTVQLVRITNVIGMIFLLIVINNLLQRDRIKNNIFNLGLIVLALMAMFFVAGRSCMVQYAIFGFGILILLWRRLKEDNKRNLLSKKTIIKIGAVAIILITLVFYLIMPLIGREQIGGPVSYMTFYLGNPLPSLQSLNDSDRLSHSEYFGQETLSTPKGILQKMGADVDYSAYQDTWVQFYNRGDPKQMLSSNTFTGMKPYYVDWDIWGIMICQMLFGIVFSALYLVASTRGSTFLYLVYGMLLINVITQVNSERLFSAISISTIVYILYLFIIDKVFFSKRLMIFSDRKESRLEKK